MRLTRTIVPRASAFLLVLLPSLLFGSMNWLRSAQFAGDEEIQFLTIMGPICLLATWCALGRTNIWLRFAIAAVSSAVGAVWFHLFDPNGNEIPVPYFIGIFATIALPLCLIRLLGCSIQLTSNSPPIASTPVVDHAGYSPPRISLWSLFQLITLGALLMAADRYYGISQEVDFDEIMMGVAISAVVANAIWISLGTRRLWLRLLVWLATPAIIYFPFDEDWNFILVAWLGLTALLSVELYGFRRLGYRLIWGHTPIIGVAEDPIPWRALLKSAAAVVAIAGYLWFFGKSIGWSQQHLLLWYIDGMASFGAYLMVTLQAPILLLAIWCALGGASLSLRLVSTFIACCLGMAYLEDARPYSPLAIETKQIYQHLLATAIPLFAFRPWGFAIRRRQGAIDQDVTRDREPQFGLKSVFVAITAAAILMGLNQFSPLFEGMFAFSVLRGLLLANLMTAAIVYACLGTTRWWFRAIPWLLCSLLSTCLLSEFPLRNFTWVASMSAAVGGVLLAFRLRGFRFLRRQPSPATAPAHSAFNPLPDLTESFTLAVSK